MFTASAGLRLSLKMQVGICPFMQFHLTVGEVGFNSADTGIYMYHVNHTNQSNTDLTKKDIISSFLRQKYKGV